MDVSLDGTQTGMIGLGLLLLTLGIIFFLRNKYKGSTEGGPDREIS